MSSTTASWRPQQVIRQRAPIIQSEEEKNVQAAAEFWAVMRATHGFQNQAAAANEVTPSTEPGTSSMQQAETFLENQRIPKRRRGSDGEYTEPTTTAALLGDIDTLKDTPTSRPDTKRCMQVDTETYAVTSQPRSHYTFDDYDSISVIDSSSPNVPVHSGDYTPAHTSTVEGHRRKKNKTRKTKHSRTPAGARRQK